MFKMARKLYDWVIHWAETPYALPALFLLAFAESSFFPVPPDVLLIALCIGAPKRSFRFAFICFAGSILGGIMGYGIGMFAREVVAEPLLDIYDPQREVFSMIKESYDIYGFWGVLVAAITLSPTRFLLSHLVYSRFPLYSFLRHLCWAEVYVSLHWQYYCISLENLSKSS